MEVPPSHNLQEHCPPPPPPCNGFKYYPFVWMFHGTQINDKINRLHERYLRIVYNDTITSFEELLVKDKTYNTSSKHSIIGNRNV